MSDAASRLSNLSGVEIAFEYTDDNDEDEDEEDDEEEADEDDEDELVEGEEDETENPRRPVYITRDQIMQLLGHAGLGRIFASDFTPRGGLRRRRIDEDEEEEQEEASDPGTGYDPVGPSRTSRRRRPRGRDLYEKVPSEQGKELMQAGNFGSNPRKEDTIKRKKRLAYDIMRRELGVGSNGRQKNATRLLKQDMIPESVADTIIHYNARCYSGQFSDDGNFFFSCAQDFRVRMYDTSNPYDWKYYKVSGKGHDLILA
jgi:WD repeat-containing protein 23